MTHPWNPFRKVILKQDPVKKHESQRLGGTTYIFFLQNYLSLLSKKLSSSSVTSKIPCYAGDRLRFAKPLNSCQGLPRLISPIASTGLVPLPTFA